MLAQQMAPDMVRLVEDRCASGAERWWWWWDEEVKIHGKSMGNPMEFMETLWKSIEILWNSWEILWNSWNCHVFFLWEWEFLTGISNVFFGTDHIGNIIDVQ